MVKPKIVAMYRIKNEERWIEKSIRSILGICSEIVIFDDGSTDKTIEICRRFKEVVDIKHQSNTTLNESRDKNLLLQMALKRRPDYLLALDGDEILQFDAEKIIFDEIIHLHPETDVFEFQFLYVWDIPERCRYDGIFGNTWHKRLIRMKNQSNDLFFSDSDYSGNLHCGSIPQNTLGIEKSVKSKMKILHYGYYDTELRNKKYQFYNKYDPESERQDRYRHIISGNTKFSGPKGMEFRSINDILAEKISERHTFSRDSDTNTNMSVKFTGERLIPNLPELIFLYQEHIVRYIFASQFVKSKTVLDAACGTGYGSSLMSERGAKKVVGVDISKEAIDYCIKHYKKENLEFKIDDCTKLQLDNSYFDVVVSFEAIEHLKEPDSFLSEVKRVLKKNGLFVVSTPNKLMYRGSNQFHVTEYTELEFRALLKKYFSFVEILYQSYPASLLIYKPGQSENITVDFPDLGIKNDRDSAMYFVALCSDKTLKDYDNKLYLFNNKTILQEEYSNLKKQVTDLKRELYMKEMEISRLESETKSNKLNSGESRSELIDDYKKQIIELQHLLNETNTSLDNMYGSFTKNITRTYAEEILDRLYREILTRPPDELAIKHYLSRLQSNEISEEDLKKLLLESDESKNLRRTS